MLGVARSHDPRVQRNATGALLNLTHIGKPSPSLSLPLSLSLSPPALPLPLSSRHPLYCLQRSFIYELIYISCALLWLVSLSSMYPKHPLYTTHPHNRSYTMFSLVYISATHQIIIPIDSNRHELVRTGAVPVFVQLLDSSDEDVQFYCAAALSNLAVHGRSGRNKLER